MSHLNNLGIVVAVPRSGSTLFMRVMANHPDIGVTSRHVLMGNMSPRKEGEPREFRPDYGIFEDENHRVFKVAERMGKKFVVSKEEYGNDRFTGTKELNECNYDMFPDTETIRATKPAFIFRKPDESFGDWLARGWNDLDSFILAYQTHLHTFERVRAINPDTAHYTHEYMIQNRDAQEKVFRSVLAPWGLEFKEDMLTFKDKFGENFLYTNEREREIYTKINPKGLFTTVSNITEIISDPPSHVDLLTDEHKDVICNELMDDYMSLHRETLQKHENVQTQGGLKR
jgi:hypothetical protein